mmetsp:Transcript_8967/g.18685  ORF Transcript_8967/g.18685 Transcript_8967/m.18685 type:complete len:231 (-) Transcript_8967:164-856(-)
MRKDDQRSWSNFNEEAFLLQGICVCCSENIPRDRAISKPLEGEIMGVFSTDLPCNTCSRGGEGDLPHRLRHEKEVAGDLLRLAAVDEELDPLGVERQPGREDDRQPVRVDSEGVRDHGVLFILHPLHSVVAQPAANRRAQVGGAVLAHRARRVFRPAHWEGHALSADVRQERNRALLEAWHGRLGEEGFARDQVLHRELVPIKREGGVPLSGEPRGEDRLRRRKVEGGLR